jgi:diaminopimelate epimerase
VRFAKAHGLGNDFILVPEEDSPPDAASWARRLCDRHTGVGGDGVVVYGLAGDAVRMRLFNADGSDGEVSGNGVRCLAAYAVARAGLPARHVVLTPPGPRPVEVEEKEPGLYRVRTDLGPAILASDRIPMSLDPARETVVDLPLEVDGRTVLVTASSLGNPHCAVFLEKDADDGVLRELGPRLERHAAFPRRTNVELVTVLAADRLRVRFWERGVGYTRASGTGAASALVAAVISGRAARKAVVVCDGGELEVEWPEGGHVTQSGEVELLFEGEWRR